MTYGVGYEHKGWNRKKSDIKKDDEEKKAVDVSKEERIEAAKEKKRDESSNKNLPDAITSDYYKELLNLGRGFENVPLEWKTKYRELLVKEINELEKKIKELNVKYSDIPSDLDVEKIFEENKAELEGILKNIEEEEKKLSDAKKEISKKDISDDKREELEGEIAASQMELEILKGEKTQKEQQKNMILEMEKLLTLSKELEDKKKELDAIIKEIGPIPAPEPAPEDLEINNSSDIRKQIDEIAKRERVAVTDLSISERMIRDAMYGKNTQQQQNDLNK